MRRRRVLATLGGAGAAALAGCMAVGSGGADYDVGMTAVAFDPTSITVAAGDEVVWLNTSSRSHTVTAYEASLPAGADFFASGGFDSETAAREAWRTELGGQIESGTRYRHTFETPGSYEYFCIPHERAGMVGTVEVTE